MKRARKIPRYDLATELIVAATAKKMGVDPDQFRSWTRGVEQPPEWFNEQFQRMLEPGVLSSLLPSWFDADTISTMRTTEIDPPKRGPAFRHGVHPLMKALLKAGVKVEQEAKAVGRSPTSLRSFCYPVGSSAHRPIPKALAEYWKKTRGVPLSAWPDIITE